MTSEFIVSQRVPRSTTASTENQHGGVYQREAPLIDFGEVV